jgi:magnesium transporter
LLFALKSNFYLRARLALPFQEPDEISFSDCCNLQQMIHYQKKIDGTIQELQSLEKGCWITITPPFNIAELEQLAEKLDIDIDYLTDPLDIDERTRFESSDNIKLIVINTPVLNDNTTEERSLYITVPIGIVFMPGYIITIASYDNSVLQHFKEPKVKGFNPHDHSLFILQIMEQNVIAYLRCLKDINVRRNVVEQEVYESSRNSDLKKLLNLEKSLVYFATELSAIGQMMLKMQRTDFLGIRNDEDKLDLIQDIIIDNSQAQEMAHIYSNILAGTMEALASMISNNLNEVMKRLTLITLLLMIPTLIASFFGMNVNLPINTDSDISFWILIGASILVSMLLVFFFQRKKMY